MSLFLRKTAVLYVFFIVLSCQKDSYNPPTPPPVTYEFNIPNTISYQFSQSAKINPEIGPFSNSLIVKNISNNTLSGDYIIFAFKNETINYQNLAFIKASSFENLDSNSSSLSNSLESSNTLFTDNNIMVTSLNFGDDNSSNFSGYYNGEINIYELDDEDNQVFIRSFPVTGVVDYLGHFTFLSKDATEQNINLIKGNFNSDNLVFGHIVKRDNSNLSQLTNTETGFNLTENTLTGTLGFTENANQRLLTFNLTY